MCVVGPIYLVRTEHITELLRIPYCLLYFCQIRVILVFGTLAVLMLTYVWNIEANSSFRRLQ